MGKNELTHIQIGLLRLQEIYVCAVVCVWHVSLYVCGCVWLCLSARGETTGGCLDLTATGTAH